MDSRQRTRLLALLLFAGALALYLRTVGFPFVEYDDPSYVRDNPFLADGLTAESVRWALTSARYAYNWHPLTWLSHALDIELFKLDAGKHHLVNALLHALHAVLLFAALRALTGRTGPSACVAAFFAVHPLRVESVAWIAERKDLLAGVCFSWTLLEYARHVRAPTRGSCARVALALGTGLLAKPTLVTVPFLLLVLDVWPLGRWAGRSPPSPPSLAPTHPGRTPGKTVGPRSGCALWLEKLPLFALSLASIAVTLVSQHAGGSVNRALSLGERLQHVPIAYVTYLRQHVLPIDLAVFYPHPAILWRGDSRLVPALLAGTLIAGLAIAALRLRRDWPWIAVGACWFLGTLVPMIGLVQVGDQAHADRYAYLSTIGIDLALVYSAAELVRRRPGLRPLAGLAGAVLVLAFAALTSRQVGHWKSSEALFGHALAVTEGNYVAHNNLGLSLGNGGKLDEALEHFQAARDILPGFFQAELNLGKAHYRRGELEDARSAFTRACAARPSSAEARFNLAVVLAALGQVERADVELEAARQLDPAYAEHERFLKVRRSLDELLQGR